MILRAAFHLLYNQFAFTYEWVAAAVSLGRWSRWRETAVTHVQPGRTLELAFGTGVLFLQLVLAGLAPIGIDRSPYMARIASRRLKKNKIPLPIACADAETLPFPAETFENIIATFPTDYIFLPQTLAEIHRVLTTNGRLIVVLQGDLREFKWLNTAIEWLYSVTGQRTVSTQTIIHRFNAAGFSAQSIHTTWQGATAHLIIAERRN